MLTLALHAGAWNIPADEDDDHRAGMSAALDAGWRTLRAGGSAVDACVATVLAMEDDPRLNAGIGASLNADGVVQLDAGIIDGRTLHSGAVTAVSRVPNPIAVARQVLDSPHLLLAGEGAERFAHDRGIAPCDPQRFVVPRESAALSRQRAAGGYDVQRSFSRGDTVGAIARDGTGALAAATSTGGTCGKMPGRVGDSPIVGAGFFADRIAACSTTGWGESILTVGLARHACERVAAQRSAQQAAADAIEHLEARVSGFGGCIVADADGAVGIAFNTGAMAYGWQRGDAERGDAERVIDVSRARPGERITVAGPSRA